MSRSLSLLKLSLQRSFYVSSFVLKKDISYISRNVRAIPHFNTQTRCYSCLSRRMSKKSQTTRTSPQSQQTARMGTKWSSSKPSSNTSSEGRAPTTRQALRNEESREVEEEKDKSLRSPVEEKRKHYKCGKNYTLLSDVPTWNESACKAEASATSPKKKKGLPKKGERRKRASLDKAKAQDLYKANKELNDKVSVWKGDITTLEIDTIVNAANESLLGGGGVDGAIHSAAGPWLKRECALLKGCKTGGAKITAGYKLPAKYVIHTVGPIGEGEEDLKSCYTTSLELMKEKGLTSIAFPCISTGIYGYPNDKAANLAMKTVREWLENDDYGEKVERVIFCLFLPIDVKLYNEGMRKYFPLVTEDNKDNGANEDSKNETEATKEKESTKETKMEVDTADREKGDDKQNKKDPVNDVDMVDKENDVDMVDKENESGDNPKETEGDNSGSGKEDKADDKVENVQKEDMASDAEKEKNVKTTKEVKDQNTQSHL